jgi:iron complex outermembrane recepter protein
MFLTSKLSLRHALLLSASVAVYACPVPAIAQQPGSQETVIVTGTRVQGMTAADSAAPITVLGSDALTQGTGTTDLRQALGQTVPSFTAQQFGSDTANLTLSAALRGLSPNDTLVLVNGHRRHYTGNLHVDSGDFSAGGAAPDISLIPEAAIDHVEVLLDGAAAQYGTDAIAGVVNIILKKKSSGGQLSATAGNYFDNGGIDTANGLKSAGTSYDFSYNMGLPLFDKGFVNFTVEKGYGNFTQNGGPDSRLVDGPSNVPLTTGLGFPLSVAQAMPGYPRTNPIIGNPEYQLTQGALNAGYDFSDNVQLYSFGTISHRFAKSYENDRMPNQIIATPGSSQPCAAANADGYGTALDAAGNVTCAIGVTGWFTPAGANNGVVVGPGVAAIPGEVGFTGLNSQGAVVASGNPGSYTSPGELLADPEGFRPQEVLQEEDYQYNVGLKFNVVGWDVDADIGYGKDIDKISTWNSGNRSLFIDTHTTPHNFYDGSFTASQFTGTIDATHAFNVGLASPLTVALGVEAREDTYGIGAGDPASYYREGVQSFPGFQPSDAGNHSRKNYAGYIDFALAPIEALQLDVAGRAEHYTDFGDTQIGKITARYDFSPQWAIRGTISTGFRAPTLAEEFYTATNVTPLSATVQLPADSAAAKILGLGNLKPEIATSYSAGIVAHPFDDLSITVDAYSTALGNRIVASSTVNSAGGAINTPLVNSAIAAVGVSLDPTATQNGVTSFLNGLNTLTQGVDLTINYPTDFGEMGSVNWTLAGNYNTTSLSGVAPTPAVLLASNPAATFFSPGNLFDFTHSAPQEKIALTANWSLDEWGITFRETYWGPQKSFTSQGGGATLADFTPDNQAGVGLTDIEVRYNVTEQLQFAVGANNIFDIRPDTVLVLPQPNGFPADDGVINNDPVGSAWNPNGGYYYGRITYNF